ncbi:uncharacterized protein TM35_000481480 [Trypanosoma theileri]|uniref:Uncharacterized protein n=1 Tax=Trypanosoma theileri TaxID=67003 RepID=A0A1X0NHP9_9TRYP|nr:uncharacterized protein TM35_000481480 [Trypanosoma theileri]ORC84187.1 hypothetical protein TM35_000481480 [Trypanosoma theileri]
MSTEVPKVTCDDVNALAKMCSISREKDITTLKECSSSLFVLLYQRLFNCSISGIETSPYTVDQKRWNVTRVLNELKDTRGIDVTGIDAEEVVHLNEEHISRLIRLFMDIAQRTGLPRGVCVGSLHSPTPTNTTTHAVGSGTVNSFYPSYNPITPRPVLAEVPHDSAEDGTWYAPVGTVDEGRSMYTYYTRNMYSYLPVQGNTINNNNNNNNTNNNAIGGVSAGITGLTTTTTTTSTTALPTATAAGNGHVDNNEPSRHPSRLMAPLDHHSHPYQQQQQQHPSQHHHHHIDSHADRAIIDGRRENTLHEGAAFPTHEEGDDDANVIHHGEMDGSSAGSYGNVEEEEIPTEQLVKAWSAEVIPPKEAPFIRDAANIADVRERLLFMQNRLDKAAWRPHNRRQRQRSFTRSSSSSSSSSGGNQKNAAVNRINIEGRKISKNKNRHPPNNNSVGVNKSNEKNRYIPRVGEKRKLDHTRAGNGKFPQNLLPGSVALTMACKQPKRMIDYTLRDEKIEMLRSLRFIDDLQKDIRRKLVERHSRETQRIREEIRYALKQDQQELIERKRQIRDEDEKYRKAYATIVAAASNNLRTADALMRERTRELSEYQAQTLRENRAMSRYLKRESKERMRHGLLHYASVVTGWQSHYVS